MDSVLDWEDSLPWDELAESEYQCSMADLCIVLGTSLQIQPTGKYSQLSDCIKEFPWQSIQPTWKYFSSSAMKIVLCVVIYLHVKATGEGIGVLKQVKLFLRWGDPP